jgi:peptide deformylase
VDTKRRQNVVANGFNEYGDPVRLVGTGLMARCCQHETDHLDGILFLDRLDAQARKAAMKEIRQAPWYDAANPPAVKVSPHATRPTR